MFFFFFTNFQDHQCSREEKAKRSNYKKRCRERRIGGVEGKENKEEEDRKKKIKWEWRKRSGGRRRANEATLECEGEEEVRKERRIIKGMQRKKK